MLCRSDFRRPTVRRSLRPKCLVIWSLPPPMRVLTVLRVLLPMQGISAAGVLNCARASVSSHRLPPAGSATTGRSRRNSLQILMCLNGRRTGGALRRVSGFMRGASRRLSRCSGTSRPPLALGSSACLASRQSGASGAWSARPGTRSGCTGSLTAPERHDGRGMACTGDIC